MHTTKTLSKKLGVNPATLRLWIRELKIPSQKQGNKLVFSPEVLDLLESVKDMRNDNCGFNTITKKIKPVITEELQCNDEDNHDNYTVILEEMKRDFSKTVEDKIQSQNELSEKYARATYEIGMLTEKVNTLESELKLLPSQSEATINQYKLQELQKESRSLSQTVEELNEVTSKQALLLKECQEKVEKYDNIQKSGFFNRLKFAFGLVSAE